MATIHLLIVLLHKTQTMGKVYKLQCLKCGSTEERMVGIDIMGQGTLYCNKCGEAKRIDFSNGWEMVDLCTCGGTFDAESMGKCTSCNTLYDKNSIIENQ